MNIKEKEKMLPPDMAEHCAGLVKKKKNCEGKVHERVREEGNEKKQGREELSHGTLGKRMK